MGSKPVPIVAIGGITLERAAEIGAIVDAVAVIGALLPPASHAIADLQRELDAVRDRARALHAAVLGERTIQARSGGDA